MRDLTLEVWQLKKNLPYRRASILHSIQAAVVLKNILEHL